MHHLWYLHTQKASIPWQRYLCEWVFCGCTTYWCCWWSSGNLIEIGMSIVWWLIIQITRTRMHDRSFNLLFNMHDNFLLESVFPLPYHHTTHFISTCRIELKSTNFYRPVWKKEKMILLWHIGELFNGYNGAIWLNWSFLQRTKFFSLNCFFFPFFQIDVHHCSSQKTVHFVRKTKLLKILSKKHTYNCQWKR